MRQAASRAHCALPAKVGPNSINDRPRRAAKCRALLRSSAPSVSDLSLRLLLLTVSTAALPRQLVGHSDSRRSLKAGRANELAALAALSSLSQSAQSQVALCAGSSPERRLCKLVGAEQTCWKSLRFRGGLLARQIRLARAGNRRRTNC